MSSAELFRHYRETDYHVDAPAGRFTLRVGQRDQELDAVLDDSGAREWAYVTAYNPGEARPAAEENERAQAELIRRLDERGLGWLPGVGEARGSSWSEPSLLVLGVERAEASALGVAFGQWAILVGRRGGPAELLDLRPLLPR